MILRAFIAIVAADAIDRRAREQQRRAWADAEAERIRAAGPPCQPLPVSGGLDPHRPERPN